METLKFAIQINAPKETVWDVLWNDITYRKWTSAFTEGSYAISDWHQGSKIQFLSSDGNGMFSVIEKKTPYQQMIFKHLGEVKNGVETTMNWGDALESYFLSELNGVTELHVEISEQPNEQFQEYLNNAFPKALQLVKELSEN